MIVCAKKDTDASHANRHWDVFKVKNKTKPEITFPLEPNTSLSSTKLQLKWLTHHMHHIITITQKIYSMVHGLLL